MHKYTFNPNPKYKSIQNKFIAVPIGKYIYKKDLRMIDQLSLSDLQDIFSQQNKFLKTKELKVVVDLEEVSTEKLIKLVFKN